MILRISSSTSHPFRFCSLYVVLMIATGTCVILLLLFLLLLLILLGDALPIIQLGRILSNNCTLRIVLSTNHLVIFGLLLIIPSKTKQPAIVPTLEALNVSLISTRPNIFSFCSGDKRPPKAAFTSSTAS